MQIIKKKLIQESQKTNLSSFNLKAKIQFNLICEFIFWNQWENTVCENSCK